MVDNWRPTGAGETAQGVEKGGERAECGRGGLNGEAWGGMEEGRSGPWRVDLGMIALAESWPPSQTWSTFMNQRKLAPLIELVQVQVGL